MSKPSFLSGPQEVKGLEVMSPRVPPGTKVDLEPGEGLKSKERTASLKKKKATLKTNIKLLKKNWPWRPDQQDKGRTFKGPDSGPILSLTFWLAPLSPLQPPLP